MASDRLEIHPKALEEIKSAVRWYRARSEGAASGFVEEVDEAIALIAGTVAGRNCGDQEVHSAPFSLCGDLSRESSNDPAAGGGAWAQTAWVLDGAAVASGICEFPVN